MTSDNSGGVWIAWEDGRYPATRDDFFAQHLTSAGTVAAGASPAGGPVCVATETQYPISIVPDALGGIYGAWNDMRYVYYGYGIGVQHLGPSGGLVTGWPSDGLQLTGMLNGGGTAPFGACAVAPDGSGGAFFGWSDIKIDRAGDFYMQHLTASGVPASGWSAGGMPIAAGAGGQGALTLLQDGSGGVIALWQDGRPGAPGIYMEHLLGDGTPAPGWAPGGVRVEFGKGFVGAGADGSGGVYLGLRLGSTAYVGTDSTYYLLRVTSTGATAPGWTPNGTLVCMADFVRGGAKLAVDATGNAFLLWADYRGHSYSQLYATKWLPAGTLAPNWQVNGTPASTLPGDQAPDDVLADGTGGVWICGEFGQGSYGFIQHLGGSGAPGVGYGPQGTTLNALPGQTDSRLASDGAGGAFVAWDNYGVGVYVNHYAGDFATATLLSLGSAVAFADRVHLSWQGDGALGVRATVERRTEATPWQSVGTPSPEGSDRLSYQDRDVVPGTRYAYRLRYTSDGAERTTTEAWVTVPAAAQLALAGLRPNPARGSSLRVAFSLASDAPARLELIDVTGRRIDGREVGALGPGEHIEMLVPGAPVPAGLYWIRLTQAARTLVTRAVVTG